MKSTANGSAPNHDKVAFFRGWEFALSLFALLALLALLTLLKMSNGSESLLSLLTSRATGGNRSCRSLQKERLEQNERIAILSFSTTRAIRS